MSIRSWRIAATALLLVAGVALGPAGGAAQEAGAPPAPNPPAAGVGPSKGPQERPAPETERPAVAFRGGTVLPGRGPAIPGGVVLVENGRIAGVGRDLVIPDDVEVVDITGKFIFPGLIDGAGAAGLASDESNASNPGDAVADGLDPFDRSLTAVLTGGVTSAFLSPKPVAPPTGMLGAVVKIRPAAAPSDFVVRDVAAVRAAVGVASGGATDTVSRWRSAQALEKALDDARRYVEAQEKYEKDLAAWKKDLAAWRRKAGVVSADAAASSERRASGSASEAGAKKAPEPRAAPAGDDRRKAGPADSAPTQKAAPTEKSATDTDPGKPRKKAPDRPKAPSRPKSDPIKDALASVLARTIPLRVEAHRVEDIERTLDLAEKFEIRLVLEGATEAARCARRLAAVDAAVVAGPLLLFDPRRLEYQGYDPHGLGALARAGVRIAVGSASPRPAAARFLRLAAARAVAGGLDRDTALAAVTAVAAEILGVADRVGSLEPGRDADLVIADRHPLDTACRIERVYVDGALVYTATRP